MTTLLARRVGFHFKEAEVRRQTLASISADEWVARQLASLRAMWADASRDIPYYRSLVQSGGAPRAVGSFEEFYDIPVLTRHILQQRASEFRRDSGAPQSIMKTAGSTGEPLRIGMNQPERDLMRIVKLAEWQAFGYTQSSRLFLIWGHGHLLGTGWRGRINHAKRKLTDAYLGYQRVDAYRLDPRACEEYAEALIRFRPIGLISYASALDLFARYTERYRDRFHALQLRFVLSTAEAPPRGDTIERLEDLFGCPVVQEYGGAEFGQVAFNRGAGPFEVYNDLNYVEAVAAEEGDPGVEPLLVTSLYSRYLPLVRYRVGDAISGVRRLPNGHVREFDTMAGRINDVIQLAPGEFIHSVAVFHCIHQEPAVHGIQMVLTDTGIDIQLVAAEGDRSALEERIRRRLAQVHPRLAAAGFTYVEDLQPTRAGKRRWYVESPDHHIMCGIAGIVNVHGGAPALAERVAVMERALSHRGPDGHGVWISGRADAAFAHTRLAIIDPTPAGRQPMSIDGGRLTITFNGEIYNFMEIRRELEGRGVTFHSRTDTEVILRAYDAFGERCVERLRGMFAFAIWDDRARQCLLARDRFGIKPLYYSADRERLVFASELRALVQSGLVPATVDASAVYEYFRAGSVPEPYTLLAGARLLEAGHVAVWHGGRLAQRRYFDLSFKPAITPDEAAERTREALIDSVQHHFVSDVPAGIFLSGGVDSTALLAIATRVHHLETRALTMALPGSSEDEVSLARRTAEHFGVRHDVCEVDVVSAKRLFAEYLQAMDQPSIDGMNTLAVSTLAQSCGVKVMLSGLGADELFGGYPSVHAVPRFAAWNRGLAAGGALRTAAGQWLERLPDPRWRRLGDMLGQEPSVATSYAMYRGIFTRADARALTAQFVPDAPGLDRTEVPDDDPTPQDAVCRLEVARYLRNQLLRDADVMSMARGVEVRVPFIDARVVDTVTAIPQRERLGSAKSLLRRAVPEIPEWIASEPKRGFMFPMERWLDGAWRGTFDDTAARAAVPTGTWYQQWCVHAFEAWLERLHRTAVPEPCATMAVTRGVNG